MTNFMERASGDQVFIIVLNWNGWKDTIECLESLQQQDHDSYRMVVVDNGSVDDSLRHIESWAGGQEQSIESLRDDVARRRGTKPLEVVSYNKSEAEAGGTGEGEKVLSACPDRALVLVQTGANLGFAGGCNVGIRYAMKRGAKYVWLLNNDTVAEPGALSGMVAVGRDDQQVGLVGSVLNYYHDPQAVQAFGGGSISWWWGTIRHYLKERVEDLDYLTGASLLIKRSVIEKIGLLDDSYFFYWEDIDYSRRALEAGWCIGVATGSRVLHKEGGTVSGGSRTKSLASDRFMVRSTVLFFRAHGGLCWPLAVLVRLSGVVVNRLRRGQADRVVPLLKVAWGACRESISATSNGPTFAR